MSAPAFIFRVIFATITVIALGAISVVGYIAVVEPFAQAPLGPPGTLGWGATDDTAVQYAMLGLLGLMVVLVVWMVSAPIRRDRRQEVRRR
jgi:hypothetical protein